MEHAKQQEHVLKLYKIIEEQIKHIPGTLPIKDRSYIANIYDITIIPAIQQYYSENLNNFQNFYPHFLTKTLKKHPINTLLQNHLNFVNQIYIQNDFKGEILGDVHENTNKIKLDNKMISNNILNIESLLNFIKNISPSFKNLIIETMLENNMVIREFLPNTKIAADLEDYYYNLGKVYSLALFLGAIDLHNENIITHNNLPIIIDWEFIMGTYHTEKQHTILTNGLLLEEIENNRSATLGGLNPITSLLKPIILDMNTEPKIIWEATSNFSNHNKPDNVTKENHPYKYCKNIIEGFENGTKEILKIKKDVINFVNKTSISTRTLVRPTAHYRTLSFLSIYNIETNIKEILKEFEILNYFEPRYEVLLQYEVEQLSKFSIPYYLISLKDKEIFTSTGVNIGTMKKSPYDHWSSYIQDFEKNIETNKELIINALASHYGNCKNK
jgi:lantibiotic modifying enzyme